MGLGEEEEEEEKEEEQSVLLTSGRPNDEDKKNHSLSADRGLVFFCFFLPGVTSRHRLTLREMCGSELVHGGVMGFGKTLNCTFKSRRLE